MDSRRLCSKACKLHHSVAVQWLPVPCGIQGIVQDDLAAKAWHDTSREMVQILFVKKKKTVTVVSAHAWSFQRSLSTDPYTKLIHHVIFTRREAPQ